MSEDRKADELSGEGSLSDKVKKNRKYKKSRLDEIMNNGNMTTTRGDNPPQTGQGSHETIDSEGNQDTLEY